jgi:hypothetical protein
MRDATPGQDKARFRITNRTLDMPEPTPVELLFSDTPPNLRLDLSAVTFVGDTLWLASDETTSLERLSRTSDGSYGYHRSFPLNDILDLPASSDDEIDIEGIDYDGSCLWLVGSHSAKRKNLKKSLQEKSMTAEEAINSLSQVKRRGNRFILARIPLVMGDDGLPEPRSQATDDAGETTQAAKLPSTPVGSTLTDAIGNKDNPDPLLAPFLELPGKENGFDIEGLAVAGNRLLLGLRGPVLRGWAMVLELETVSDDSGNLKLKKIGPDGRRYRRHLLDLRGLGIRDLSLHGDDLFILAGPTMDHDGPVLLFLWKDALQMTDESVITKDHLTLLFPIPPTTGANRAEGITLMPGGKSLLVVYDSPGRERLTDNGGVMADIFSLV